MSSSVGGVSAGGAAGQGGNGSVGSGSGGSGPCGACKFLRRKCVSNCIFAPYFDQEQGAAHFAAVHRVFGASNVSKLLNHLPEEKRIDAVLTVCFEAQARLRDPVYGCVSHIFALQQQIVSLQSELNCIQNHLLAAMEQSSQQVPFPAAQPQMPMAAFSVSDLPPSANIQPNVDLSFLLDEQASQQLQQQYVRVAAASGGAGGSGTGDTGDLHAVARELLNRHDREAGPAPPSPRTHQ
ncbi:hypothetical protein QOZ80_2AG0120840 [Eleusine coracana subsp. coracana]|nr:hypothetical protein QOZ80_2AG0120840 [Eleusine coracana subsp. coracana]